MPRKVTVTFADGSSHAYEGVPDEISPQEVVDRATREFSKPVKALDGGRGTLERAASAVTGVIGELYDGVMGGNNAVAGASKARGLGTVASGAYNAIDQAMQPVRDAVGYDAAEQNRKTDELARQLRERDQADIAKQDGMLDAAGDLFTRGMVGMGAGIERVASGLALNDEERQRFVNRARASEQVAKMPIAGETTWDAATSDITKLPGFLAEQAIASLPYMATAAAGTFGALSNMGSVTGDVAQRRAEADGRKDATARDVGIAAPFGVVSTALDSLALGSMLTNVGTRGVGKAIGVGALTEGVTEGIQSGIEYTGGSVGTEQGFNASELGSQMLQGAVVGAGVGGMFGGVSGGAKEAFDAAGRIKFRRADDTRTPGPGIVEQAVAGAVNLTSEDLASPLDNADLAAGKAEIAAATAGSDLDSALTQAGLPKAGTRVSVAGLPGGGTLTGTIEDVVSDETGTGVVVRPEGGGSPMREYLDTLNELGVSITPFDPTAEADAIDAALAAQASAPVEGSLPLPAAGAEVAPSGPSGRTPSAATGGATTFDMNSYMARVRQAESGGKDNAKAGTSSATGRYQFTDGTWLTAYKAVFGDTGESKDQILAKRGDGAVQDRLMAKLTQDNADALRKAGLPVNDTTLYLAHFAGIGGARSILKVAPERSVETVLGKKAVAANPFLKGKTAGDVIAWAAGKMGGAAPALASDEMASEDVANEEALSTRAKTEPETFASPTRQRGAQEDEIADAADTSPDAGANLMDLPNGKSFALIGASESEVAAIKEFAPAAKAIRRKDGALVFAKKYETSVREAIGRGVKAVPPTTQQPSVANAPAPDLPLQPQDEIGFSAMTGSNGMAAGIGEGLRNALLAKVEAGDVTENGQPSAILQAAKLIKDAGVKVDAAVLDRLSAGIDNAKSSGDFQGGMRALVSDIVSQNTAGPQDGGVPPTVEAPQAGGPEATADSNAGSAAGVATAQEPARPTPASDLRRAQAEFDAGRITAEELRPIADAFDEARRARRENEPLPEPQNPTSPARVEDTGTGKSVATAPDRPQQEPSKVKPTKAQQLADLQAMKDRGASNGEISVAAERMPDVLQVDLMKILGMDVDAALDEVTRPGSKRAADKKANPFVKVGERYTVNQDVDYLSAGSTYEVESTTRNAAYFRNVEKGGGTSVKSYMLQRALADGVMLLAEPVEVANPVDTPAPDAPARIEDFGEQLVGARKDVWQSYKDRLNDAAEIDVTAEPLSKTWPEPDYQKLLDAGADPYVVAWVHAARDEIPTKPQKGWKLKGWAENVHLLRDTATKLLNDEIGADALMKRMSGELSRSLRDLQGRVDLYREMGHSKSLKGVTFAEHHFSLYRGERDVTKWVVEKRAKATAFGNWPREIAVGDTREEALAKFKAIYDAGNLDGKQDKIVRFDIYSRRGEPGFAIGKKIGKDYVDLKRFDTAKEARDFKISDAGYTELVAALDGYKDIPAERKASNAPRIGIDHRSGADVTPEAFAEAFGFRGVQFGNYVEGDRRQSDLNEAYDALMDLAGVVGVPARALSLNGELGLAFGARGKGGKGAAAAHFEPDTIVINLTKNKGAGSLAHEWWHSLDNYFSRMRGPGGYMTEGKIAATEGVRPEMVQAFKDVMAALRSTSLKERSKNLDKRRTKEYWATDIEMSARAFESYVIAKLQDEQFSNDYLANIVSEQAFGIEDGYPYLRAAEIPVVRAAFDNFFATAETRETERGLALFSVPEGGVADETTDVRTTLQEQLANLRLADKVKVRLVDTLGGAAGQYQGGIITIATDTPQGEVFTLNHEAIHVLRDMGVFKNEEWAILSARARRETGLMRSIRQRYEAGFRQRGMTGAQLEEALIEEAASDMFARFQDGRYRAEGTVDRLFKMLRQLFEAVRNAFAGRGLRTSEGVMQDVASGEVGARNGQAMPDGSERGIARSVPIQRKAINLVEARDAASAFVGEPIKNESTGLVATVSRNNLLKMTSAKAVQKSTSALDHALAVANVDRLFAAASLQESHADRKGEPTIAAIHRYVARMETGDGGVMDVKMTVKETTGPSQPNPLYTVETLEVEPPSVSETSAPDQSRNVAPGGSDADIVENDGDAKFSIPEREDLIAQGGTDPTFDNSDIEARFQAAKDGVGSQITLRDRIADSMERAWQGITRHWINLPNIPEYAALQEKLRAIEAAPQAAKERTLRMLDEMVRDFSNQDLDLFTRKVILDDLFWDASNERDLPFGFTRETLTAERAKIDQILEAQPDGKILSAVAKRKRVNRVIAKELVEAGVLEAEAIKNPAYYRHQVLEYARAQMKIASGPGKRLRSPKWAKRMGSSLDVNANLLEAEFDWLNKAFVDIPVARSIEWIKNSEHNILDRLRAEARENNRKGIEERVNEAQDIVDNPREHEAEDVARAAALISISRSFGRNIAMGFGKVRAALESGEVDYPARFEAVANGIVEGNNDNQQPPFELLTWMLDNNAPGAIGAAMIMKAVGQRRSWTKEVLGQAYVEPDSANDLVDRLAPEGYTTWQPDEGKLLFTVKTIPERVIDEMLLQMDTPKGVDPEVVRAALESARTSMALGGMKYTMILPEEVAATLNQLRREEVDSIGKTLVREPVRMWKRWVLINPRRFLKYNINNLSGDLDAIIAGKPKALRRVGEAGRELYRVMKKGEKPSARYEEAVARGVFDSGLSVQEIPDIHTLEPFERFAKKPNLASKMTVMVLRKGWNALQGFTQWREGVFRYALYLDYVDRLEAGETQASVGYGASRPEMVDAVPDLKDRAALLARDLIGDYGAISHYGANLRETILPFWSWMEINTKRYWRLTANAYGQGVGKGLTSSSRLAALASIKSATLLLRMGVVFAAIMAWNSLLFGDEEDDLSEDQRRQMHLIFGRNDDGTIRTMRLQGSFSDAMNWFGWQDVMAATKEYELGRRSLGDVLIAAAKAPVNKVGTSLAPTITVPLESAFGKKLWPDLFNTRPLDDGWRNLFSTFSLENEYDLVMDRPSRGYARSWVEAVLYRRDPGEMAYGEVRGKVYDWLERERGQSGGGGVSTPKSKAAKDYRQALKFGDLEAARGAWDRMVDLGVTENGYRAMISRAAPLGPLAKKDRQAFVDQMTDEEYQAYLRADAWYRETFRPDEIGVRTDEEVEE